MKEKIFSFKWKTSLEKKFEQEAENVFARKISIENVTKIKIENSIFIQIWCIGPFDY